MGEKEKSKRVVLWETDFNKSGRNVQSSQTDLFVIQQTEREQRMEVADWLQFTMLGWI